MFQWGIGSITFSGGEEISLDPGSVFIIVGPNSSGKSTSLRQIEDMIHNSTHPQTVIQTVHQFRTTDKVELRLWLEQHYPSRPVTQGKVFVAQRTTVFEHDMQWGPIRDSGLGNVAQFLMHRLDTESRLQLANRTQAMAYAHTPEAYIHFLQLDESLLAAVSGELRKAFGKDLIINYGGAAEVWFHVGDEPNRTTEKDRVSPEYLNKLNQLPQLHHEGDGVRSFVGTLLAAKCGAHLVLLIDEPEAFLHPPQIRRLARTLAASAKALNRQIIVATHSSDVIRGALSESDRVTICRLTRQGNQNHATVLSSDRVKALFSNPLLRSAAAVDGVFYDGVVVCEADNDCRFYEALVRQMEAKEPLGKSSSFYFVHGSGKGSIPTLASAYKQLGVPVAATADFDLLKNEGEFRNVIIALGADFAQFKDPYRKVIADLNELPPHKALPDFLTEMRAQLDSLEPQDALTGAERQLLKDLIDDAGEWSEAKKYGIDKLSGGAHQACEKLLKECRAIGLFLVPKGELESWWRGGPKDKNEWSRLAIEQVALDNGLFRDALEFTMSICEYLRISTT
jgi:ABC-type cobalamin/Fe3+-siderophores transport system ATPase subunit